MSNIKREPERNHKLKVYLALVHGELLQQGGRHGGRRTSDARSAIAVTDDREMVGTQTMPRNRPVSWYSCAGRGRVSIEDLTVGGHSLLGR